MPLLCIMYFSLGSACSSYLARQLASITYKQEELEGSFRYAHFSYNTNFETISVLSGLCYEQAALRGSFTQVVNNKVRLIKQQLNVNMFTNWFDLMGAIGTTLVMNGYCCYVNDNFSWVVSMYIQLITLLLDPQYLWYRQETFNYQVAQMPKQSQCLPLGRMRV